MVQEVMAVQRRLDRLEGTRRAPEVEAIVQVVRTRVGRAERAEAERLFDELQDAAELVALVRDVRGLGIGRDDDQRNAKAELVRVILRRLYVLVPPAPVVPNDEDRGAVPIRAIPDRVDDPGDP